MKPRYLLLILLTLLTQPAIADEVRPGYIGIEETAEDVFSILWKRPAKSGQPLALQIQLPDECDTRTDIITQSVNNTYIQNWSIRCEDGLVDKSIQVIGLDKTNLEVIIQMQFIDGMSHSARLRPTDTSYLVPTKASPVDVVSTYTLFGIEHILIGIDHLLFVLALLMIVEGTRKLIITITAFTIAHSITLAAATLNIVDVPQQPVEAVIALSILFLAVEIIHGKQGRPGYAARWPWLVAFSFGLLHGFGFAGALTEIGLPQQSIPLALVFFNVGVELGQLLFIFGVILVGKIMMMANLKSISDRAEGIAVYSIGGLASFWLIERISAF